MIENREHAVCDAYKTLGGALVVLRARRRGAHSLAGTICTAFTNALWSSSMGSRVSSNSPTVLLVVWMARVPPPEELAARGCDATSCCPFTDTDRVLGVGAGSAKRSCSSTVQDGGTANTKTSFRLRDWQADASTDVVGTFGTATCSTPALEP